MNRSNAAPIPHRYVTYYRVSTHRQGRSGLGLDAQREIVRRYLQARPGHVVGEFAETASGMRRDRPEFKKAVELCRSHRATLLIATLDRLARSVAMIADLMDSGFDFVAADFPDANRFTVHVLAALAEYERSLISERLKEALAAARARGVKCGRPSGFRSPRAAASLVHARKAKSERIAKRYDDLAPLIRQLAADGLCGREIAAELNRRGVRSTWGREWKSSAMYTALRRAQIATGSNAAARDARRTGSRLTRKARVALFIAPLLWRHYSAVGRFEDVAEALNREGHRTPRGGSWCKGAIADYLTITEFTPVPDKDLSIPLRAAVRERRVARQLAKMAIMEAAEQVWACRIKGLSGSEIVTVLSSEGIDVRLAQETCGYVAMVVKNSGVTRGRFSRRRSVMLREQS